MHTYGKAPAYIHEVAFKQSPCTYNSPDHGGLFHVYRALIFSCVSLITPPWHTHKHAYVRTWHAYITLMPLSSVGSANVRWWRRGACCLPTYRGCLVQHLHRYWYIVPARLLSLSLSGPRQAATERTISRNRAYHTRRKDKTQQTQIDRQSQTFQTQDTDNLRLFRLRLRLLPAVTCVMRKSSQGNLQIWWNCLCACVVLCVLLECLSQET